MIADVLVTQIGLGVDQVIGYPGIYCFKHKKG